MEPEVTAATVAMALDLVRVLRTAGVEDARGAEDMSEDDWLKAGQEVWRQRARRGDPPPRKKSYTPSKATRAAVVAVFRDRDKHPDPFEGFAKHAERIADIDHALNYPHVSKEER